MSEITSIWLTPEALEHVQKFKGTTISCALEPFEGGVEFQLKPELHYEEAVQTIHNFPITWYPALILEMLEAAWKKKVFRKGGASSMVTKLEQKNGWGPE